MKGKAMKHQKFSGQKLHKIIFACSLSLSLSGCFQPVNSVQIGNSSMASALSEVSIGKIDGYLGYVLKSELDFLLSQTGGSQAKRYVLNVKTQQTLENPVVDSVTGRAQVTSLAVQAIYDLRDTKSGKLLANGTTFANANYDRPSQRFAAERARRDAEERVAKSLAERLRGITISALASGNTQSQDNKPEFIKNVFDDIDNTNLSGQKDDE